ncbi:MAG: peptidoglycan DD-metalloendopeptidase family protein [Kofleriaceae bacterium]
MPVWPWVAGGAAVGAWYLLRERRSTLDALVAQDDARMAVRAELADLVRSVGGSVGGVASVPGVIATTVPSVVASPIPSVVASPMPSVVAPPVPSVVAPPIPSVVAAPAPARPPGEWSWPLPSWGEYAPVISDGWGSRRDGGARSHKGVDLMYRRRSVVDKLGTFPAAPPHSLWHFVPPGTVVMAAAEGFLWSAGKTPRGYAVVLSHGKPWASYYTHLASLMVPEVARGAGRLPIVRGQPLGLVGVDPTNPTIAHLHFEIWQGAGDAAIDPAPVLARASVLSRPVIVSRPADDLDQIFAAYGRGIPVAYLRALARAESGLQPHHPMGVINVVKVALDAYRDRHPTSAVRATDLRDPVVSVTVAADHLRMIGAALATNHPDVRNLQEDWRNPRYVELLTAAWNSGHSERAGVGRGAAWLAAHGQEVTVTNLWRFAREAGLASTFTNRRKLEFATRVAEEYMRAEARAEVTR